MPWETARVTFASVSLKSVGPCGFGWPWLQKTVSRCASTPLSAIRPQVESCVDGEEFTTSKFQFAPKKPRGTSRFAAVAGVTAARAASTAMVKTPASLTSGQNQDRSASCGSPALAGNFGGDDHGWLRTRLKAVVLTRILGGRPDRVVPVPGAAQLCVPVEPGREGHPRCQGEHIHRTDPRGLSLP